MLAGTLAGGGCGELWVPSEHAVGQFALDCYHPQVSCAACHGEGEAGPLDAACVACHDADRPDSHDPLTTSVCAECHTDCSAGWTKVGHPDDLFPLLCSHSDLTCDDCHGEGEPGALDPSCISCHLDDRPTSHDPATTEDCFACHQGCTWDDVSAYHGEGFAEGAAHGQAMKLQDASEGDCRECHGADLTGGDAVGCDDCHADSGIADWRTDCVLCHGGTLDSTGAPPLDIDDSATGISFASHNAHVTAGDHPAYGCVTCHVDSTTALSPQHIFDTTPAVSEVVMGGGLSPAGVYDFSGGCSNLYCHGNGRTSNGTATDGTDALACDDCHGMRSGLSGEHGRHIKEGGDCIECHATVVDRSERIVDGDAHVDGVVDVVMHPDNDITWSGSTCGGGACHGEEHPHNRDTWYESR